MKDLKFQASGIGRAFLKIRKMFFAGDQGVEGGENDAGEAGVERYRNRFRPIVLMSSTL